MNNCKLYVDFHVLQTVPPSCVNRDDTGSPKTALYGGATRARLLSGVETGNTADVFRGAVIQGTGREADEKNL